MRIQLLYFMSLLFMMTICYDLPGAKTNLYIHVKKNTIEIGEYKGKHLCSKKFKSYKIDHIDKEEIKRYLLGKEEEIVLYYIHCWLGNISFYNKSSISALQKLEGIDKTISIKWEGKGLNYHKNWINSKNEGRKIGELFEYLVHSPHKNNVLLCHSMGHEVFTGLYESLKPDEQYFKIIFMASADLPKDILSNELKDLPGMTQDLYIYEHNKDRFLQFATIVHKQKRLGLPDTMDSEVYQLISNLTIINVTCLNGRNWINPSNHIYFKDHSGVREDMNDRLHSFTCNKSKSRY
ncbi:MAG: alpha/beta hydrolase [Saprospiraceae bacterium]|nr:alpha/beta hydrolase [Candidatus Brachybacter algidus]